MVSRPLCVIAVSQAPTVVEWQSRPPVLPIRPADWRSHDQARSLLLLAGLAPQATGNALFRLAIHNPVRPAWRLCVPRLPNSAPLPPHCRPIVSTAALPLSAIARE